MCWVHYSGLIDLCDSPMPTLVNNIGPQVPHEYAYSKRCYDSTCVLFYIYGLYYNIYSMEPCTQANPSGLDKLLF